MYVSGVSGLTTFLTDLPPRLASVIVAPWGADCVYALRNWSAGTPLIRNAMTLTLVVPPKATLRSDGDFPSWVRIGPISFPAVPDPRKSEPVMLRTVRFSPAISDGNMPSSSVSALNDGSAKLKPGRPEAPGASVEGASVADGSVAAA